MIMRGLRWAPAAVFFVVGLASAALGQGPPAQVIVRTDKTVDRVMAAAREWAREDAWDEAIRALQFILDDRNDTFLVREVRVAKDGAVETLFVSARSEAARVLQALPAQGREFYQFTYGPVANALLGEAKTRSDLEEVVQRFLCTDAGTRALELLATYHLDRGRYLSAARCYQALLDRSGLEQLKPVSLFKAALALHRAGERAEGERAWQQLAHKLGKEGLRIGDRTLTLEQLRQELEKAAP